MNNPPATTQNEDFKFITNDGKFSVFVYSIPSEDFVSIDLARNAQLAKALSLYSDRKISDISFDQNSNLHQEVVNHMMDNFSDILCIKYAIVNSWAMIGDNYNKNLVFVGGSPNIWIISNC
jgi:hypothetical protein